jgi:hypothetical protein
MNANYGFVKNQEGEKLKMNKKERKAILALYREILSQKGLDKTEQEIATTEGSKCKSKVYEFSSNRLGFALKRLRLFLEEHGLSLEILQEEFRED